MAVDHRQIAIQMIELCDDDPGDVARMCRTVADGFDEIVNRNFADKRQAMRSVMIQDAKDRFAAQIAPWFDPCQSATAN